jgi:hypothetical protein
MLRALEASTWLEGKVEKGKVNTGGDYNRLMLEKKVVGELQASWIRRRRGKDLIEDSFNRRGRAAAGRGTN